MSAREDQRPTAQPVEIDPMTHPILATHWPSVAPNWRAIGGVLAGIIADIEIEQLPDDDLDAAA